MTTFNPEDYGQYMAEAVNRYPQIIPTQDYARGLINDMETNGLAESGALRLWRKKWICHWPSFEAWLAGELNPQQKAAG